MSGSRLQVGVFASKKSLAPLLQALQDPAAAWPSNVDLVAFTDCAPEMPLAVAALDALIYGSSMETEADGQALLQALATLRAARPGTDRRSLIALALWGPRAQEFAIRRPAVILAANEAPHLPPGASVVARLRAVLPLLSPRSTADRWRLVGGVMASAEAHQHDVRLKLEESVEAHRQQTVQALADVKTWETHAHEVRDQLQSAQQYMGKAEQEHNAYLAQTEQKHGAHLAQAEQKHSALLQEHDQAMEQLFTFRNALRESQASTKELRQALAQAVAHQTTAQTDQAALAMGQVVIEGRLAAWQWRYAEEQSHREDLERAQSRQAARTAAASEREADLRAKLAQRTDALHLAEKARLVTDEMKHDLLERTRLLEERKNALVTLEAALIRHHGALRERERELSDCRVSLAEMQQRIEAQERQIEWLETRTHQQEELVKTLQQVLSQQEGFVVMGETFSDHGS